MYLELSDPEFAAKVERDRDNGTANPVSPITDDDTGLINRESGSDSTLTGSQGSSTTDDGSDTGPLNGADQVHGFRHQATQTFASSNNQPQPDQPRSAVLPLNDSATRDTPRTANSRIHAIAAQSSAKLTSAIAALDELLSKSRDQLESTSIALNMTLQDLPDSGSADASTDTNPVQSQLMEQIRNLQQQVEMIDTQRESLEQDLSTPSSRAVSTQRAGSSGQSSEPPPDIKQQSSPRSSNSKALLGSSIPSRKHQASAQAGSSSKKIKSSKAVLDPSEDEHTDLPDL